MAVPEYEYPGMSLSGCQALYDLWVEFNISASATTQTTCDPVNQYNGLQTKTVLQSICARQARVECLILDHHVCLYSGILPLICHLVRQMLVHMYLLL